MNITKQQIRTSTILKGFLVFFLLFQFIMIPILELNLIIISVLSLILSILLVYPSENSTSKILGCIYSILMLFLIRFNLVEFDFIPQARVLLEGDSSLIYWFSVGHVHSIRLLIAYPGYLLSKLYGIDLNQGFTYYGLILFIIMYINISNTLCKYRIEKRTIAKEIKLLLLLVPLIILPLIMNGRLIVAYTGFSILIDLYLDLYEGIKMGRTKVIIITIIGLVMNMVSSGTMMVAIIYVISMLYLLNYGNFNKKIFVKRMFILLLLLSPLIFLLLKYSWIMLNKNITFFGGGIDGVINMLNHGLGRFFVVSQDIIFLFLAISIVFIVINYKYVKKEIINNERSLPIFIGINIAMYGLLFGFSTGLMMIPPFLVYILIKL